MRLKPSPLELSRRTRYASMCFKIICQLRKKAVILRLKGEEREQKEIKARKAWSQDYGVPVRSVNVPLYVQMRGSQPKRTQCRRCFKDALVWANPDGGTWCLFESDGVTPHWKNCLPKRGGAFPPKKPPWKT